VKKEINRVVLVGYVANVPEVRVTKEGKRVGTLTVATHRKEATDWHRLVAFDEEIIDGMERDIEKGTYVYAEGRLQTRKWQDKHQQNHYMTEVVLEIFHPLKQEKQDVPQNMSLKEFLEEL